MNPAALAAAKAMFRAARIEASQEDLDVLAEDIAALAEERNGPRDDGDYLAAASELGRRVGGLTSLRTYVDVIKGGLKRPPPA